MAKKSALQIVTANHLLEGHSIFLGEAGWTADHHAARVAHAPEEAAALEALGRADEVGNTVVGVYLVDVALDENGDPEPIHYREKMRVRAIPSFWPDPAKTARAPSFRQRGDGDPQHVSI